MYRVWASVVIGLLIGVVAVLVGELEKAHIKLAQYEETIDYLNNPERETVIVVSENLKSRQDRVRISIENLVAEQGYRRVPNDVLDNLGRIVVKYSDRYKVPANLIVALMAVESQFNTQAVSHMGALGITQVMPSTAQTIARELGVKQYDLFELDCGVRFGTYYLRKMLKTFNGDIDQAVRAYNSGPDNTSQGVRPKETVSYHKSVMRLYNDLEVNYYASVSSCL